MKVLLDFSKSGTEIGIDNMQIWLVLEGINYLIQGDKRFFNDKEELENNVKYIRDYLNTYGKNALFQNKWTKHDAKRYLAILSKIS
ncbi:TPA: hypothetical protein ACGXMG_003886 [Bacillus paranthracis]